MKRILIAALVVAVLGAAGYFYFAGSNGKAPPYRTVKVEKGEISDTGSATGNINGGTTVQVGSQVSGTIQQIYADFNSRVRKGEVIAKIDPQIFEASVVQARGSVANATAVVEKAKIVTADALRTLRRNQELIKDGYVAQADVDAAETAYDSAASQQKSAEAQLDQTRGALSVAETNLRYTTIVSPVDGIVISRNVDVGQTVAASFQTPTLFTIAQDLTKMQINTNVDEADIGKIKMGQPVEFNVDAYPEIIFNGKVWQIRIAPITVQNVVTYDVVIKMDNPELQLKPGMTANVSILTAVKKDILKIPNAAMRFRPSDKNKVNAQQKGFGVWQLVNGEPNRIPVSAGISDGSFTEVISGDIREGQEIIIESLDESKGTSPPVSGPRFF